MMDKLLRSALRSLFLPLANLLIRNGVEVGPVVRELKQAYVLAARENHGLRNRTASINRVSQVTGISRPHVTELLNAADSEDKVPPAAFPRDPDVLSLWATSERYLDQNGNPRALEFGPGVATFESLVTESAENRPAREVLNSMIESKNVSLQSDGLYSLDHRSIPSRGDLAEIITVFLAPLARTMETNWGKATYETLACRVAHSGTVPPEKIPVIRRTTKDKVRQFIREADDLICSLEARPDDPRLAEDDQVRIGVGAFYFEIDDTHSK